METVSVGPPPKKVRRLNRCLCHCREDASSKLTSFTVDSWQTLRRSAEVRRDDVYDFVAPHLDEPPFGGYHRTCYQSYTNKTLLSRLQLKRLKVEGDDDGGQSSGNISESLECRRSRVRTWQLGPRGSQKCQRQWSKFLSLGASNSELVHFLDVEWTKPRFAARLNGRTLYVCDGPVCCKLSAQSNEQVECAEVAELESTQEEADTRLLLHCAHAASQGHQTIIIKSPDTDVAVIACLAIDSVPATILFRTGTKNRTRFVNITTMGQRFGRQISAALVGLHAFTGCDSTSAFAGRGKKAGFGHTHRLKGLSAELALSAMSSLGQSCTLADVNGAVVLLLEMFTCHLYGKPAETSINEARYQLFCTKPTQSSYLPPCFDALWHHMLRANYQAFIWRNALIAVTNPAHCPHTNGWTLDGNNHLRIQWLSRPPAPTSLLELISCGCTTGCSSKRCLCRANGLLCTDICSCKKCTNKEENEEQEPDGGDVDLVGDGNEASNSEEEQPQSRLKLYMCRLCHHH